MTDFLSFTGLDDFALFNIIAILCTVAVGGIALLLYRASRLSRRRPMYEYHYVLSLIVIIPCALIALMLARVVFLWAMNGSVTFSRP